MDWNEFSEKRIIKTFQRIQSIVIYEELVDGKPVQKEAVVDQIDQASWAPFAH